MLARLTVLAAALFATSLPALAADAPEMTGVWKGTVKDAVLVGSTPYRKGEAGRKVTFSDQAIEFTFDIKEQRGQRFAGKLTGMKHTETLIGYVHSDGKTGQMLDDDGSYTFTLTAPGTMDVCYDHSKPDSKVIACWTATRSK